MGLLSHISSMNQPKGGLLALAEQYGKKDNNYNIWALENHFSTSCVFAPCGNFYFPLLSSGLDEESIINCVSTSDFWNGFNLKENTASVFSDNEAAPFCQLFSNTIKNDIFAVSVLPLVIDGKNFYFLSLTPAEIKADIINKDLVSMIKSYSGEVLSDTSIKDDSFDGLQANLFIISAKLSIENCVRNFQDELKAQLEKALFIQIFNRISKLFPSPNCCVSGKNFEIKAAVLSKEEIDEKLLEHHLNNSLSRFFNNNSNSNLLVLTAGCCFNVKGTKAFLEQN